ncbi:laminin subunit gamma-3 [Corythoichthys intestinalis]|uniref:laminin subunit gamma-3 n=1 Tax=Corythoichthys intestinalis TaxID=161448 RepID=UPI0025A4D1A1|nr:laminin subunit gamma-3 [Corythoichthys intestinalis]XP_057674387.1 laminin subunit gamma-3 [Corythoichthys intestinalis]
MDTRLAVWFHLLALLQPQAGASMDSCYDEETGTPSRCLPKFENVAFNRSVEASNQCGSPPEDYCTQMGSAARSCHRCDASDPDFSHSAALLTDFHRGDEPTHWQSQSMYFGIQHPNSVNLTLHLGKAYEITYIRLKFYTSRPESFAIYRRSQADGPWLPYQFYSASCRETYGKSVNGFLHLGDDERTALCTDEFSDIAPLTGGNVAFSTLEGRPSAYNFDQSLVLQEWVTATDLLVSLDRLNTFGDEVFKDAKVLRSYFYAISDFSVGGRCKCNGHASECVRADSGKDGEGLVCACQHHTEGDDCQRCQPFYRDRPWARATGESANECLRCNCSGRSDRCEFDVEQYRSTGSGGRCLDCRDNTDGAHCERCRANHYRGSPDLPCLPCNCNPNGSASLQCDSEGRCTCGGRGVTGDKCDKCRSGFHSLAPGGCRPCDCAPGGSVGACSPLDGSCHCKDNAEGGSCDRCKPGFFNLQENNPAGCQPCFCFGHSLACSSSNHYVAVNITSDFMEDQDGWLGEFSGGRLEPLLWKEGEVYLLPLSEVDPGYYRAPDKFLGDQGHTHNQPLFITFTSETPELLPDHVTVLLDGAGLTLAAELAPGPVHHQEVTPTKTFVVRLVESQMTPKVSALEFGRLLRNVTALRVSNAGGLNYTSQLSGVSLSSASPTADPTAPPAPWVESCTCPTGFLGQFCERCAPGFTREVPGGGPFSTCIPCDCHQHGICHPESGECKCSDFTDGLSCERCLEGYYGNPLIGTPGDCQPCPCPGGSSCVHVAETDTVVCTNCPAGQTGTRCQMCDDGYYGDPLGHSGRTRECSRCDCSGNVDLNAVGVCDRLTGRCLKCTGNTEGDRCQNCRRGYYGDARSNRPGLKCKPCNCDPAGTSDHATECHPETGTCECLNYVTGRDCSRCEEGFFNLRHGKGCERCECHPIGSSSAACHPITGQCSCRGGVEGRLCDVCRAGFFGFSSRGCRACDCDPMGAVSMQCHANGTCTCRPGFTGSKCNKCQPNYFHNRGTHQCQECPACYGLVQQEAEKLRTRLRDTEELLARFDCHGRLGTRRTTPGNPEDGIHQNQRDREVLPNALEEFLAFQETREAFIQQFSSLEVSTGALELQLRRLVTTFNCSVSTKEEEKKFGSMCQILSEMALVVGESQAELEQATKDLDTLIIPFEVESGPNQWKTMVNESQVLNKSHGDAADYIEAVAERALAASKRNFASLMELLQDNSTDEYVVDLTQRMTLMRQKRQNLTTLVNESVADDEAPKNNGDRLRVVLADVTSQLNRRAGGDELTMRGNSLLKKSKELDESIRSKDDLIGKITGDTRSLVEVIGNKQEVLNGVTELQARARWTKLVSLASVVAGKAAESEEISLDRDLQNMAREWPRLQAQTRAALKKKKPLEDKVLAGVTNLASEIREMLRPARENSRLAKNASREAEQTAGTVAEESKLVLTQAKHTKTACAHLSSHVDSALQSLAAQTAMAQNAKSHTVAAEPGPPLAEVKKDVEAAKQQLEAYSLTLTELISKIDANVPLERFHNVLNETARRLTMLRGSVESPLLGAKIGSLRSAAEGQRGRLALLERDVQEISQERDSLRDIAQHLPPSCLEAGGKERS